ncbi:ABC transporter related protein [Paenibacillus algicola]|uniref:ABC transporter related protein n=1 Tax=Paenibacillus algicola TaxID=2565926 RepID=A0A4P8XTL7_9BACL|nr:ABC transporter ATP-binding protein [Paenibacillus algicola]QCT04069.1 ABC transporter related protein [Paenibacillus algicola]
MKDLMYFIAKLYRASGFRLVLNITLVLVISLLEGLGLYLIIPLLGMIGLLEQQAWNDWPLVSGVQTLLEGWFTELSLLLVLVLYVLILGGQAMLTRLQSLLSTRMLQGFIRRMRMETYEGLLYARWEFFLRSRKSDFHHMMSNELGRVNQGVFLFMSMITAGLFTLIQIGLAFWISPLLTAFVLLSGAALALFGRRYIRGSKRVGEQTTELSKYYFAGIQEHFSGIKDIKSNRLEPFHTSWFARLSRQMETNFITFGDINSKSQLIYRLSSVLLIAGFIYVSIEMLHTPAEKLILIVLIFSRLWPRFIAIQSQSEQLVTNIPAFTAMRRLEQELRQEREWTGGEEENKGKQEKLHMTQGIQCRGVSYRYKPDSPVYALRDITIQIPARQMTAIVGRSGAGKSTLMDLLMGLISPESGEVLVDGIPLKEQQLYRLRDGIGYVPQDPFLFHESIRHNLKLVAPDASEEELWEALRFSASEEFVRSLPLGLDTVIGDRGIRLSGGERQRIVLARAILKRPTLLVLDEATSALDTENERLIQTALESLRGSMTIVVIAHRLSTIRNADQVIVMEQGAVIQQGGYRQLAQDRQGRFSRLLQEQTGMTK